MAQERVQRQRPERTTEPAPEQAETTTPEPADLSYTDELLDEIDAVLEIEGDFALNYRQAGGE